MALTQTQTSACNLEALFQGRAQATHRSGHGHALSLHGCKRHRTVKWSLKARRASSLCSFLAYFAFSLILPYQTDFFQLLRYTRTFVCVSKAYLSDQLVADTFSSDMSTEKQVATLRLAPPARAERGTPLTDTNLAAHERNTSTVSTNRSIRDWLNVSEGCLRHDVDLEAWTQLFRRDPVAAAIEAATEHISQRK
jgi:hypothetical protein